MISIEISIKKNIDLIDSTVSDSDDCLGNVMEAFFSWIKKISEKPEFVRYSALDLELFAEASRNESIAALHRKNFEAKEGNTISVKNQSRKLIDTLEIGQWANRQGQTLSGSV